MLFSLLIGAEDYIENSSTLVFPTNSSNNSTKCITVSIQEDSILEPLQYFSVILTTSDPDVLIQNRQLIINIIDDDGEQILPNFICF